MRTRVGIVGAGPAGLVLSHLLSLEGIDSVVLERRDREYVESRVRAGGIEPRTVERLAALGVDGRLRREGLVHDSTTIRFDGHTHEISFQQLTGQSLTIYAQHKLVQDLIGARLGAGGTILFGVEDVALSGLGSGRPTIHFGQDGRSGELECDVIAGCDGYHGASRGWMPADVLTTYVREYPFGWLGVLAEAPPSASSAIYCYHRRGFALASMRSPELSRHYLQVDVRDPLDRWPDDRIWEELATRLAAEGEDWQLNVGAIVDKAIAPVRAFVAAPMQHRELFLAGDATHIVPPTGAKGLNLAVADAWTLGEALSHWSRTGDPGLLDAYTRTCLSRVWRRQEFSIYMTELLHVLDSDDPAFRHELQLSRLNYLVRSTAAQTSLAENYMGYDPDDAPPRARVGPRHG